MHDASGVRAPLRKASRSRLNIVAFAMILLLWTWMLVKPNPVPQIMAENLLDDVKYILGKALHFGMYAFFAWYGTLLGWRSVWLGLGLFFHAVLTELGQYYGAIHFDTHRTGRVADVLIDTAGIVAGLVSRGRQPPELRAIGMSPSSTDCGG